MTGHKKMRSFNEKLSHKGWWRDDDDKDVNDIWQTVQPSIFSEKQAQWLRLQFCPITVGVTE